MDGDLIWILHRIIFKQNNDNGDLISEAYVSYYQDLCEYYSEYPALQDRFEYLYKNRDHLAQRSIDWVPYNKKDSFVYNVFQHGLAKDLFSSITSEPLLITDRAELVEPKTKHTLCFTFPQLQQRITFPLHYPTGTVPNNNIQLEVVWNRENDLDKVHYLFEIQKL
jgi:hypothetical protein